MMPHAHTRLGWWTALLLAGAAVFIVARCALAQSLVGDGAGGAAPRPPTHAGRDAGRGAVDYAVLLARVAVNEDSRPLRPLSDGGTDGEPSADTLAIIQVAHDWARWQGVSVARAIRALAPHVTGSKAATLRRHAVYGALPARGGERPLPWDDAVDGAWRVHGPRWVKLRDAVARLLGRVVRPCGDALVVAWGNQHDASIAVSRGLVQVDCGETINGYWALPPDRVLAASAADGRGER